MQMELGSGSSQMQPRERLESSLLATLERIEHDLSDLIGALALLGVKRCSQCRQFLRCADPGALFGDTELVCYGCIPNWWPDVSKRLGIADRERIEGKLATWLRKHHRAEVVKVAAGNSPDLINAEFQIAVRCIECAGTGKLMEGERCRFCNGLGTVRIVVPK